MTSRLGIVAGGGDLPARLASACEAAGRDHFILALEGHADPALVEGRDHAWVRLGAADTALRRLREAGVGDVVLAGRVRRPALAELKPDWRTARLFARIGMRAVGDDGLLRAVVAELEGEGFRVVGVDAVLGGILAPKGPMGRHRPNADAERDLARGVEVARALGGLDVGQAVVVQAGIVLGVEAIEGTDALIARCAGLRREGPGGVLVKFCKPQQERRVDLPTVGPDTVREAAAAGLRGIAVEAGATIVVDRDAMVRAADAAGLFLVGLERGT